MKYDFVSILAVAWRDRLHMEELDNHTSALPTMGGSPSAPNSSLSLASYPTTTASSSAPSAGSTQAGGARYTGGTHPGGAITSGAMKALCCTVKDRRQRAVALRALEAYLCAVVAEFAAVYPTTSATVGAPELSFFSLVVNFLQIITVQGTRPIATTNNHQKHLHGSLNTPPRGLCYTVLSVHQKLALLSNLRSIFVAIDEKALDTYNQSLEEKPANAARARIGSRERNKALRRVCHSLLYLLQELSIQASGSSGSHGSNSYSSNIGPSSGSSALCTTVVETHSYLITHLQRARLASLQPVAYDIDHPMAAGTTPVKPDGGGLTSPMAGAAGGGAGGSKNGATPLASPSAKENGGKRRCQEIIIKPLEFCRSQEGFVVQGDSLLSNFKGIDFTLATWIFASKKASTKHSFITGKVSHHDAWPMIALRPDGKLDIVYGHSSEFETMTSVAAIPLHTWTHIAVVVEQKKIKLFINGVVDSQAATKGNARAVMYPIVVGSCPSGLRTHVDHVRIGFDGILAQYRYYTRALSPIHIRVVFDQGPPEAYDVRERWIFKLLASLQFLLQSKHHISPPVLQGTADRLMVTTNQSIYQSINQPTTHITLPTTHQTTNPNPNPPSLLAQMLIVTDSTRRVRCSAIRLLERILLLDAISDLTLTSHRTSSAGVSGLGPLPSPTATNSAMQVRTR